MKKLFFLCLTLSLLLLAELGISQPYLLKSEISPIQSNTDSRPNVVATVMDDDTWCHVEWPGLANLQELVNNRDERDIDYYQVDRFSNFFPCGGDPLSGDTTFLDTTSISDYHDYNWAGLPQGGYAYGVKTHYSTGEWSDYEVSNIVGHHMTVTVTFNIILCDTTWSEYTVFTLNGDTCPLEINGGWGTITFESNEPCGINGYVSVCCPGNYCYFEDLHITSDKIIDILLSSITYPITNLNVDPVSLHASWDPPQVVNLDEYFEQEYFPPIGWLETSQGTGWFRTNNGSSAGWTIPYWHSHYACTNDLLAGNGNNGSQDYLFSLPVDLRYRFNNFLSFYSYYDGSNGQQAYVEYSFDGSNWETLYQLEPSSHWQKIELDLSALSGPESDPVWFAFHSDDNGLEASGWAVDSVRVYSPEPPYTLDGYYVFLNDSLVGITDSTFFDLPALTYGEEYSLKVKAHYPSSPSYQEEITFTSHFLYPPTCLFLGDSIPLQIIICPPMDSTGAIPPGLMGYNLYRDGDFVDYIQYYPTPPPTYWDEGPDPGTHLYGITAVYELSAYGYPGEEGESMPLYKKYITNYAYPLPFMEQWNLGNFYENNWTTDGSNWSVSPQVGNPIPSAQFTWDPIITNYESSLTSYPFQADAMTEGQLYLDFDLKLASADPTGAELMLIQVWAWENQVWNSVDTISNADGSFDWTSQHIDISSIAMGQVFKIRFSAQGENSLNILGWYIDNIQVYRTCNPPQDLNVNWQYYLQSIELNWGSPEGAGLDEQWIHWDDGVNSGNSIGGPSEFSVAARWTPAQLTDFVGGSLTKIAFYPDEESATYHVRVWEGENGANLIVDQPVPSITADNWNIVTLNSPVPIDITQELWVGYYIHTDTGYPAGVDDGPAVDGYGNMIYFGQWQTLLEIDPDMDYNWNIEAFIEQSSFDSIVKYAIYRSDDSNPYFLRNYALQTYYIDDSVCWEVPHLFFKYKVTALYIHETDTCESDYSNVDAEICEGISDNSEGSFINIYPNPCNDLLKIESSEELGLISLYNAFGELILKKKVDDKQLEIPVAAYPAGVYMIRVETGKEVVSRKVMVVH